MKKNVSFDLCMKGLMIAAHVVLSSYFTIKTPVINVGFSSLPIAVAALMYGPLGGFEVGFIGSFLQQLISYGLMPTTVIWVIPYAVFGLLIGSYAKLKNYRLSRVQLVGIILFSTIVMTVINTLGMFVDSKIYGYYSFKAVFAAVPLRLLSGLVRSVIYAAIIYPLVSRLDFMKTRIRGAVM